MAGIEHGPDDKAPAEATPRAARHARYGMVLFFVYLAVYAAFVLLNAFRPAVMDVDIAGVNLAVWYGFGLIVLALALALLYAWLCRTPQTPPGDANGEGAQP